MGYHLEQNMGRKKILGGNSQAPEACEVKPFCYYCDREFDSTKTLIQHQRTKHLACAECGLKFDTVTGLRVHMLNAYKKTMKEVPNSIPGRENPDIVVHGMEGLPKGVLEEKTRKALAERAERERVKDEENKERQKALSTSRAVNEGKGEERQQQDDQEAKTAKAVVATRVEAKMVPEVRTVAVAPVSQDVATGVAAAPEL